MMSTAPVGLTERNVNTMPNVETMVNSYNAMVANGAPIKSPVRAAVAPVVPQRQGSVKKRRTSLHAGESRRDRFGQRKQTEAPRLITERPFGLVGRSSGVALRNEVIKDKRGFDDVDHMFDSSGEEESAPNTPAVHSAVATPLAVAMTPAAAGDGLVVGDFGADQASKRSLAFDTSSSSTPPINAHLDDDDDNNDYDDAGMADEHMFDDLQSDAQPSEESENVDPVAHVFEAPAPVVKKRRANNGPRKHRRRNTLQIVDVAENSGIIDLCDAGKLGMAQNALGRRTSQRRKFAPLEFWRNEKLNFVRSNSAMSHVMSTLAEDAPVVAPPVVEPKKRTYTKPRARKSRRKNGGRKRRADSDDEEDEAEMEPRAPIKSQSAVLDSDTNSEMLAQIAKSSTNIQLQTIHQQLPEGQASVARPQGGKSFDEEKFSSGNLVLPPGSVKWSEVAAATELFVVLSGGRNALQVRIHKTDYTFSKGDTFYVPAGNVYQLKNASTTKPVKLNFTLIN